MSDTTTRITTATVDTARRTSGAKLHMHASGAAIMIGSVIAYSTTGAGWGLFVLLLFAPDLFMLGYLAGPRTGAVVYNIGHSLLWPAGLVGVGLLAGGPPLLVSVGIIWAAHIGMDWALGYGYKYPTDFQDTHLGRI